MRELTTLLICALTCACGGEQSQLHEYVVSDSAGIRVVENYRELADSVWHTSDEPLLELGHEARGPHLFRVMGAVRLSDGTIVVANSGTGELILFDARGEHLRTTGGEGKGPGEFAFMVTLAVLPGDTLLTSDLMQKRLSWFDSQGRFVRSTQVPPDPPLYQPTPIGFLNDSTVAVYQGAMTLAAQGPIRTDRPYETVYRYTLGRAEPESLASFPGIEVAITKSSAAAQARGVYFQQGPREFGRRTSYGVARQRLFVADSDEFEIRGYTADGNLTEIIRRRDAPVVPTGTDLDLLRRMELEAVPERSRQVIADYRRSCPDPPETMPALDPLLLFDADDRLWVPEYHWPPDAPYRWSVFDRDGFLDATVLTPYDLRVLAVGTDFVLGLWRDEDDVEYVRLYELVASS